MNRREVLQAAAGIAIVSALPSRTTKPVYCQANLIVESTVHDGPWPMEFGYESGPEQGSLRDRFQAAVEWFKRKTDIAPDLKAPTVVGFYKGDGTTWPLPGLRGLPTRSEAYGYEVVVEPFLLDGISTDAIWTQGRYDLIDYARRMRKMDGRGVWGAGSWRDLAVIHVELPMRYAGGRPGVWPA